MNGEIIFKNTVSVFLSILGCFLSESPDNCTTNLKNHHIWVDTVHYIMFFYYLLLIKKKKKVSLLSISSQELSIIF